MKRVAVAVMIAASAPYGSADPLRLRANALATTASPAGVLSLEATGDAVSNVSAEAVVWVGSAPHPGEPAPGDVLVIAVRARSDTGRAHGTFGRFVATLGALRPTHVDGGAARVQLPYRLQLEAFAGIPVLPRASGARSWDWATGVRASRKLGDWGSAGLAFGEQRDAGRLVHEQLAADVGTALNSKDALAAKLAYDVATPGIAQAALTASHRRRRWRGDLFASYRAASHLVPATSLFSVLGDVPAVRTGASLTWRAAPRLDVDGQLGVRSAEGIAPLAFVRGRLRLDDAGTRVVTGELRRDGAADDAWTGARLASRLALTRAFALATELELVAPDHARGRGALWPWALAAVSWSAGLWTAAAALEASASPEHRYRVDVLVQLGRRWGEP